MRRRGPQRKAEAEADHCRCDAGPALVCLDVLCVLQSWRSDVVVLALHVFVFVLVLCSVFLGGRWSFANAACCDRMFAILARFTSLGKITDGDDLIQSFHEGYQVRSVVHIPAFACACSCAGGLVGPTLLFIIAPVGWLVSNPSSWWQQHSLAAAVARDL